MQIVLFTYKCSSYIILQLVEVLGIQGNHGVQNLITYLEFQPCL